MENVHVLGISEDSKLLLSLLKSEAEAAPEYTTPGVTAFTVLHYMNCSFPPKGC